MFNNVQLVAITLALASTIAARQGDVLLHPNSNTCGGASYGCKNLKFNAPEVVCCRIKGSPPKGHSIQFRDFSGVQVFGTSDNACSGEKIVDQARAGNNNFCLKRKGNKVYGSGYIVADGEGASSALTQTTCSAQTKCKPVMADAAWTADGTEYDIGSMTVEQSDEFMKHLLANTPAAAMPAEFDSFKA